MRFVYIGRCASGFVEFKRNDEVARMPQGEAVEVPEWLEKKLAANSHFEAVEEEEVSFSDNLGEMTDGPAGKEETVTIRRKPGRPRKTEV